jgi:hypothetical protein
MNLRGKYYQMYISQAKNYKDWLYSI